MEEQDKLISLQKIEPESKFSSATQMDTKRSRSRIKNSRIMLDRLNNNKSLSKTVDGSEQQLDIMTPLRMKKSRDGSMDKSRNYESSRMQTVSSKDITDLQRAFSTYLNTTGPGQYDLPPATIGKQVVSTKRSNPQFSMQSKTKITYFPQTQNAFKGKDSPGIKYHPDGLRVKMQDPKFSIGKFDRFHLPEEDTQIKSNLPVQYQSKVLPSDTHKYKEISLGYGKKMTYKTDKNDEDIPGPIYPTNYLQSIKYRMDKLESKRDSTFGCDKEQASKVMYAGQERHFYGRHSPGPGVYQDIGSINKPLSSVRSQLKYSIPKDSRGLLEVQKNNKPNPHSYSTIDTYSAIQKRDGAFSMPRSERSFNFAKYNSIHSVLVSKGLY